jgi:hypothetical protein
MMIFDVAEVQRRKEFLQTNNLRPFLSGFADIRNGFLNVGFNISLATHLHQTNPDIF